MDNIRAQKPKNRQQKYRQARASMELVRYELQVKAESKVRFENLVRAVADEYEAPWDERQRLAKARCQVFDEITQAVVHEFVGLQAHINSLKAEIKALSPSFFIDTQQSTVLPEAILALPDDPKLLKSVLAKTYSDAKQAKQMAQKYKNSSEQYRKLHEVSTSYNDDLQKQLKIAGAYAD